MALWRKFGRVWRELVVAAAAVTLSACVGFTGDIPYGALEAKYDNPQTRFLDTAEGVRVRYRDQGPAGAPVLVMVHGFSASLEAWEPWVARLSGDYRVITLDLPGHGLTRAPVDYRPSIDGYADLTDALARRLGVSSYVIVGNSMGGAVAWDDVLRHRDHVRGLVLVDAAGWPGKRAGGGGAAVFVLLGNPLGRAVLRHIDTRPMATSGLKSAYVDRALVTPALVDRYVDFSRAPGHRDLMLRIQTRPSTPVTADTFHAMDVPTLVMHGEADHLIPLADGKGFAAAIPHARLITYPGVGHVPMEQTPDRSAADLRDFLATLPR